MNYQYAAWFFFLLKVAISYGSKNGLRLAQL